MYCSFQAGVPRRRPSWFCTIFVISILARIRLLDRSWIFPAHFLHSSISACSLLHSYSDRHATSRGFSWISFVVFPGVACLLPIMICFAAIKHPLFALKMALFTLLMQVCVSCRRSGWSSSSCCFWLAISISPSHSSLVPGLPLSSDALCAVPSLLRLR